MKRAFDALSSGVALIVLSPVLALIAVVLRGRHGNPILFKQERVGRGGEVFKVHKFRTMEQFPGIAVTAGEDSRVHSTGRILRATKLDELPQFWDVLRGKMSVVGPRPEVPQFVSHWPEDQRDVILTVRPGITDPASIKFRHESQVLAKHSDPQQAYIDIILPEKCRLYVEYVEQASLPADLLLILKTFAAILKPSRGVHA
ncbi:sugar transferase [Terrabacter sp. 2RAF25]|uniref:sugar transferase n=1 Tax=Terrabacter sp. 2RAF25 TaxID=3232998 RepID=UPI003F9D1EED